MKKLQVQGLTIAKALPWLMTIFGSIGFLAAFVLTIEKIELIKDPKFIPSCNFNPILSCGSVMKTHQAEVFGFPNSMIGIACFAVIATIGLALLAGATYKRWFWLIVQAGVLFAIGFIHWLIFQSIFNIGALCPYCMVVWSVTIPTFLYVTLYNFQAGHIKTPASLKKPIAFITKHHGDILALWYLIILALILNHFWYYWKTLV